MSEEIIRLHEDFWNIRGNFRIFGLLNIGTQCSLARLRNGNFVMLDAYTLKGEVLEAVMERTHGGELLEAIVHVHPFHTVHAEPVAKHFPDARLFGTARHHQKFPDLPWQPELTETAAFHALYAEDFDFMVPTGVDFIPENENLHFASVLAFHKVSRTLHVDDTLNWLPLPWGGKLGFHPTLKQVLHDRPEAATEFRAWANALADRCETIDHVCTAHARIAPVSQDPPGKIAQRVREALESIEGILRKHEGR